MIRVQICPFMRGLREKELNSAVVGVVIVFSSIIFFPLFSLSMEKEKIKEHVDTSVPERIGPFQIAVTKGEMHHVTLLLEQRWWDLWSSDGRHIAEDHRYGIKEIVIEFPRKPEVRQSFQDRCYSPGGNTVKMVKRYVEEKYGAERDIPAHSDFIDIMDLNGDGYTDFRLLCFSNRFEKKYMTFIYNPSSGMYNQMNPFKKE